MTKSASVFTNGGRQAVRLPVEFRLSGDEVYVWRDEPMGDVVLSAPPPGHREDLARVRNQSRPVPDGFLLDRRQS